jgi:hypothetical protein
VHSCKDCLQLGSCLLTSCRRGLSLLRTSGWALLWSSTHVALSCWMLMRRPCTTWRRMHIGSRGLTITGWVPAALVLISGQLEVPFNLVNVTDNVWMCPQIHRVMMLCVPTDHGEDSRLSAWGLWPAGSPACVTNQPGQRGARLHNQGTAPRKNIVN